MFNRWVSAKAVITMFITASLALAVGCGRQDQNPFAPDGAATVTKAPVRAAKKGGQKHQTVDSTEEGIASTSSTLYVQSDQGMFAPRQGGVLRVTMPVYGDAQTIRLKKAVFEVLDGSLDQRAEITMTAYSGYTLDDVWVAFDPSGLTFNPPARLTLVLQGPVTEDDVRQAYHLYGDGSNVESMATEVSSTGKAFLTVSFKVPGFSRYTLGGGQDQYAPEAW